MNVLHLPNNTNVDASPVVIRTRKLRKKGTTTTRTEDRPLGEIQTIKYRDNKRLLNNKEAFR